MAQEPVQKEKMSPESSSDKRASNIAAAQRWIEELDPLDLAAFHYSIREQDAIANGVKQAEKVPSNEKEVNNISADIEEGLIERVAETAGGKPIDPSPHEIKPAGSGLPEGSSA